MFLLGYSSGVDDKAMFFLPPDYADTYLFILVCAKEVI